MDFFQARTVLGVDLGASALALKAAYRRAAMRHHPDRAGGSEEMFKKIAAAFELLSANTTATDSDSAHRPHARAGSAASGAHRPRRQTPQEQQAQAPAIFDHTVYKNITVQQAFHGDTITIDTVSGSYTIEVPAGTCQEDIVWVHELDDGRRTGWVANIISTRHAIYWGADVADSAAGTMSVKLEVPITKMITGGWVTLENFDGENLRFWMPAGTPANAPFKIKNKGFWRPADRSQRADLTVRAWPIIQQPSEMNEADRAALRAAMDC